MVLGPTAVFSITDGLPGAGHCGVFMPIPQGSASVLVPFYPRTPFSKEVTPFARLPPPPMRGRAGLLAQLPGGGGPDEEIQRGAHHGGRCPLTTVVPKEPVATLTRSLPAPALQFSTQCQLRLFFIL